MQLFHLWREYIQGCIVGEVISWFRISKAVTWRLYLLYRAWLPWPQPCHTPWLTLLCLIKMQMLFLDFPDKEEMTKCTLQTLHTVLHRWVCELLHLKNSDRDYISEIDLRSKSNQKKITELCDVLWHGNQHDCPTPPWNHQMINLQRWSLHNFAISIYLIFFLTLRYRRIYVLH